MHAVPRRRVWATVVGAVAEFAGRSVGRVSRMRTLPGVLGIGSVTLGFGLIWTPLAFIVGGVFLLVIDNRVT